jgi:hypothetical protein
MPPSQRRGKRIELDQLPGHLPLVNLCPARALVIVLSTDDTLPFPLGPSNPSWVPQQSVSLTCCFQSLCNSVSQSIFGPTNDPGGQARFALDERVQYRVAEAARYDHRDLASIDKR